jgi:hypothetical protein
MLALVSNATAGPPMSAPAQPASTRGVDPLIPGISKGSACRKGKWDYRHGARTKEVHQLKQVPQVYSLKGLCLADIVQFLEQEIRLSCPKECLVVSGLAAAFGRGTLMAVDIKQTKFDASALARLDPSAGPNGERRALSHLAAAAFRRIYSENFTL